MCSLGELALVPQPGAHTSEAAPMECANGASAGAGAEGNRPKVSDTRISHPPFRFLSPHLQTPCVHV
jgi:hypothetical protein